jgi:hypothetical protein
MFQRSNGAVAREARETWLQKLRQTIAVGFAIMDWKMIINDLLGKLNTARAVISGAANNATAAKTLSSSPINLNGEICARIPLIYRATLNKFYFSRAQSIPFPFSAKSRLKPRQNVPHSAPSTVVKRVRKSLHSLSIFSLVCARFLRAKSASSSISTSG